MSQLTTDFSNNPYHDDHDNSKQFYRILFIPSRAVQTRELNQTQAIIQEQIRRFGDHVFKDGSIVDGCNITHHPKMAYVRLNNSWNNTSANSQFTISELQSMLVVSNTGVRASIRMVEPGYVGQYPDTNTLYVDYITTGRDISNNEVSTFQSGEQLTFYTTDQEKLANTLVANLVYNTMNVVTSSNTVEPTGVAYAVTVGDGIVYQKGYFVSVNPHTIAVKKYDTNTTNMLVGFETVESIVTHLQDTSLIDPADTSARNAIGADRLKLQPVLVAKDRTEITDADDFFPIIEFNDTSPVTQRTDPEYAALGDVIATRVYEPHGDFYINPMIVNTGPAANTNNFQYLVNPGTVYAKGNRVELLSTRYLELDRATTTDESNASIVTLNFGNYVVVDEFVGLFNFDQFAVIGIYNTAQNSISDREGGGTAPSGVGIGTANIRAVKYDSGTKGTPTAQYRLYITNIQMSPGKSFSNDAKSFYYAAGEAKADIVLEGGKAVLKDTTKNSLIFNTGVEGLKRLRNSSGVNDSQFYFRDYASATLQSNGSVTFTMNSPHAGGNEQLFASPGTLSSANELRIDLIVPDNAYTSNLTGTVQSNTNSNLTLIGTSTTFTSHYSTGDFIRVSANSTSHFVRRITNVINNTHMTIDADITQANASAVHQRYILGGTVLDLDDATVTVTSNTQFTIDLNLPATIASGAPQTVYATYPVLRTEAVESKKLARKSRYVKINCTSNTSGPWNLGLTDVYAVEGIWVGSTYSESNPSRVSWFQLDNGQTESHYDHAKLQIKPAYKNSITSATRILVKLSYFAADNTSGIGFFSVDSYPARLPGVSANSTNISFADIPTFQGISLRSCIDYRPRKINTAADATTIGAATENPAASNTSYSISGSGTYMAEPDTNFQADIEYYLPRIDLIQVSKDGTFNVKKSTPSVKPKTPAIDGDAFGIAVSYVPPFPSLTTPERELYGNSQPAIVTSLSGTKNYTMKDIYGLDQRITRLEYYQTLSLLESQAKDYVIRDENGLDRFKNGIFADPFNNHLLGDVSNFEYSIAIDSGLSLARPKFKKNSIDFNVGTLNNTTALGNILTLPYSSQLFIQQKYASKFRNATEDVWRWSGDLVLFPSYDYFHDEKNAPAVNVTLDLATPWQEFANSPFAVDYGDWRVVNTNTAVNQTVSGSTMGNGSQIINAVTTTTATTTTTTLNQTVQSLDVQTQQNKHDLGSYITDITLNPYMRSREIAFIATGLKPNTRFWVYFDEQPVSTFCAPASLTNAFNPATGTATVTVGKESAVVRRTAAWGTALVSDSTGNLFGLFLIPDGQFRVGDRILKIANVDDLVTGSDAITSSVRATYSASSLSTTSRSMSLTTIEPKVSTRTTTNVDVISSTSVASRRNVSVINIAQPATVEETAEEVPEPELTDGGQGDPGSDPLGQTVLIQTPTNVPGMYLDKIGVFFKAKDPQLGITMVLTEVTAGVPDTTKIVARSYLAPSAITVSDDASSETVFKFNNIPYLASDKYYAWFLQPDGNSPEYLVWMAEIGGTDIASGVKIFSNPYIGTAVKSTNSNSWTVLGTEDIKFNLYRCLFTASTGTAQFVDDDREYLTVDGFSLANSSISPQVGDVVYSQDANGDLMLANTDPTGFLYQFDEADDLLIIDDSTGGFAANTTIEIHRPSQAGNAAAINANTLIATSTIVTVDDLDYSVVVPRFGTVTPLGTDVKVQYKGMTSAESVDANWYDMQFEYEREFIDKMRTVKSVSNRSAVDYSSQFQLTLMTNSNYLTPVIDLRRKNAFLIENIINDDLTDEDTRYGAALTKYISRRITLKDGQEAEDIQVFVTGYRPVNTDITCYVKFYNDEDPEQFNEKLWTKMAVISGGSVYSSPLDVNDYREFGFGVPTAEAQQGEAWLNSGNDGIIQYRNADGSVYSSFKSFSIKLVLTSSRRELVPRMRDVRAICLQI